MQLLSEGRVEYVIPGWTGKELNVLKVLLIGIAAPVLFSACATVPPHAPASASELASTPASETRLRTEPCLTTGTRIALKDGECANVPGRSYSKEDLDTTGAATVDEALRMLDPALNR